MIKVLTPTVTVVISPHQQRSTDRRMNMITFTIGFFLMLFGFLVGFVTCALLRQTEPEHDEHENFTEGL